MKKPKGWGLLSFFLTYSFWQIIGLCLITALWSSVMTSISQNKDIAFYFRNVILFPFEHPFGLIFDLPFDLLEDPLHILLTLIISVAAAILIFRNEKLRKKIRIIITFGLVLAATISWLIFSINHNNCLGNLERCSVIREISPNIFSLTALAFIGLFPLTFIQKNTNYFAQALRGGLIGLLILIISFFLAVYLPVGINVWAYEDYQQMIAKRRISNAKAEVEFKLPSYLPENIGEKIEELPSEGVTVVYSCGQTNLAGLKIDYSLLEKTTRDDQNYREAFLKDQRRAYYGDNRLKFALNKTLVTLVFDQNCQPKNELEELIKIAQSII